MAIITRASKGSALTHTEMDNNLKQIPNGANSAITDDGVNIIVTGNINGAAADDLVNKITISQANSTDLGVGQSWTTVTGSRSIGVAYTNTTGKPIEVNITTVALTSGLAISEAQVDGVLIGKVFTSGTQYDTNTLSFIVPDASAYAINTTNANIHYWKELR